MEVFGFDFGTTNSLISQVIGDQTVVFDQGEEPYPSVVCYEGCLLYTSPSPRD